MSLLDLARSEQDRPEEEPSPSESSWEALAHSNPTAYRLLYVLNTWAAYIAQGSVQSRIARFLPMVVPHMAADLAVIPEEPLRAGLVQIREAVDAILNGEQPAAAPAVESEPAAPEDAGGADAATG